MTARQLVLIDTNFFLLPSQFRIDIFRELEKYGHAATLDMCMKELKRISKGRGKSAGQAKVALALIKKKGVKIIKATAEKTDLALLNYAKKHCSAVATNDRKLIKNLKNNGISIIRLRQKKYLIMV
jgi:rRNA-processing protein FCF1